MTAPDVRSTAEPALRTSAFRRGVRFHRARFVIVDPSTVLENAAIEVARGRVLRVAACPARFVPDRGAVQDHGEVVLAPGLVDAHAHLELSGSRGALPRTNELAAWIEALLAWRRSPAGADLRPGAALGARRLLATGTTAVGDIDSSGAVRHALQALPLRARVYREVLDAGDPARTAAALAAYDAASLAASAAALAASEGGRARQAADRAARPVQRAAQEEQRTPRDAEPAARRSDPAAPEADRPAPSPGPIARRPSQTLLAGLSPHAPYTVSPELWRELARRARARRLWIGIHWAESEHEEPWLLHGAGPLARLLSRVPGTSGLAAIEAAGLLSPRTALYHGNHPARGDLERVAGSGASLVHCPGTHAWFGRERFPIERWLAAGVPLALGTDSLASNEDLDLRREMALLRAASPALAPAQVLALATTGAARALGLEGRAGTLAPGAWADFAAHDLEAKTAAEVLEALTSGAGLVRAVAIGGRAC